MSYLAAKRILKEDFSENCSVLQETIKRNNSELTNQYNEFVKVTWTWMYLMSDSDSHHKMIKYLETFAI